MSALGTQVGGHHYMGTQIQPVQFIESNELGFLEGCVVKRVTRHNRVGGKGKQDILKAIHELQLLLELRYPEPLEEKMTRELVEAGKPYVKQPWEPVDSRIANTACPLCGAADGHGALGCPNRVKLTDDRPGQPDHVYTM